MLDDSSWFPDVNTKTRAGVPLELNWLIELGCHPRMHAYILLVHSDVFVSFFGFISDHDNKSLCFDCPIVSTCVANKGAFPATL